jgi:hypothetical protein
MTIAKSRPCPRAPSAAVVLERIVAIAILAELPADHDRLPAMECAGHL